MKQLAIQLYTDNYDNNGICTFRGLYDPAPRYTPYPSLYPSLTHLIGLIEEILDALCDAPYPSLYPSLTHLIGFIEEILDALCDAPYETEGVSEYVQAQHEDVHLFDGLAGVMVNQLCGQLLLIIETVVPLKIAKPEKNKKQ